MNHLTSPKGEVLLFGTAICAIHFQTHNSERVERSRRPSSCGSHSPQRSPAALSEDGTPTSERQPALNGHAEPSRTYLCEGSSFMEN